jgi:hypothetical protein
MLHFGGYSLLAANNALAALVKDARNGTNSDKITIGRLSGMIDQTIGLLPIEDEKSYNALSRNQLGIRYIQDSFGNLQVRLESNGDHHTVLDVNGPIRLSVPKGSSVTMLPDPQASVKMVLADKPSYTALDLVSPA